MTTEAPSPLMLEAARPLIEAIAPAMSPAEQRQICEKIWRTMHRHTAVPDVTTLIYQGPGRYLAKSDLKVFAAAWALRSDNRQVPPIGHVALALNTADRVVRRRMLKLAEARIFRINPHWKRGSRTNRYLFSKRNAPRLVRFLTKEGRP